MVVDYLHLVPEQQRLLAELPFEGHHLVTGPPGSGKSLLAVQRAVMLALTGAPVTLLTVTPPQRHAAEQVLGLLGPDVDVQVRTVAQWLAERRGGPFRGTRPTLVVDEGHACPAALPALCRAVAARTTVFAEDSGTGDGDELTPEGIGRLLTGPARYRLTATHRTTRQIAALAARFAPSSVPEPPPRTGPTPVLHRYAGNSEVADHVAEHRAAHPNRRVGVIVSGARDRADLAGMLAARLPGDRLWTFPGRDGGVDGTTATAGPGVAVVSRRGARGLEFDTVFVPDADVPGVAEETFLRTGFLRLASRARTELHLGHRGPAEPEILASIPAEILARSGRPLRPAVPRPRA